jgi:chemotaxis protein MotB
MAKKKRGNSDAHGVPEWVVTFGDMMSLLLCFFILLQMFSELKQDREYQRVVTAIKEAFGYAGGVGVMPMDDPPLRSLVEVLETLAIKNNNDVVHDSNAQDPGMDGPQMRVTKVREGIVFTIGGPSTFDPLSAEIKESVKQEIRELAKLLVGRNNKIEIIGHAAPNYLPADSPWEDLDDLSYHRAVNVKNLLIECGLDDRVFRLEAAGTREPVRPRAMDPADAAENRRVEIILTEVLVEEMNADARHTSASAARGG